MGGVWSTYEGKGIGVQDFGGETWKKENTCETWA